MNYYIDGDVEKPQKFEKIYSSIYSGNQQNGAISIEIGKQVQKEINYRTFRELGEFYNKSFDKFKIIRDQLDFDIWFLEQFRLYFRYRNFELKLEAINIFLKKHPDGIILTNDKKLQWFYPDSSMKLATLKNIEKAEGAKELIQEFFYVLSHISFKKIRLQGSIILSNPSDNIDGKDKRFGILEDNYSKVLIRNLFKDHEKSKVIVNEMKSNTDRILASYIISFRWINHIPIFLQSIKTTAKLFKDKSQLSSNEKVISQLFWSSKSSFLLYYIRYQSFNLFFKKNNKITGSLLSDENSPQQKVIQFAAKRNGVKVYGFQHGTIHDLHPAYMYANYKHKPFLPDITFTWGEYFTDLLTSKGGYNRNQVSAVGRISQVTDNRRSNKLLETTKKIILYASQPQRDLALRTRMLEDVLIASEYYKDRYLCVIRPHPAERTDDFFKETAKKLGCSNYIIDRYSDLKIHFEKCAILVNSFSTVGSEFVCYKKPMLVLDYLQQDLIGYIKYKVGISIQGLESLKAILESAEISVDPEAHDYFVKQFFFKDDGLAASRVKEIIEIRK